MNETREEFLDRLHHVVMNTPGGYLDEAEAVYAQALRDIRAEMNRKEAPWYPEDVDDYAAMRGIRLRTMR